MNILENLQHDTEVMAELRSRLESGRGLPKAVKFGAGVGDVKATLESSFDMSDPALEAVILDFLRPCLIVKNNSFSLPASDVWKSRLEPYRKIIEKTIPSVGRVEFKHHPRFKWGGTGWLIAENIVVTNTHVASLFAFKAATGITMIQNSLGATIEAYIDFNEEYQTTSKAMEFGVEQVLYLADKGQPDVAILKLSPTKGLIEPVPLFSGKNLKASSEVVVLGYPAYDPYRNPLKPEDVARIFDNVFECKRLSPGLILNESYSDTVFTHDATTLGGNSGSVVIDLKSGKAVGLHFSGVFHDSNYAVKSHTLLDILSKTNVMIPVSKPVVSIPPPKDTENNFEEGARPEDYIDREGYVEDFLGSDAVVPLPVVNDGNILTFGDNESVLKYHHFSVVMNSSRRLCYYSAVNINGAQNKKTKRPNWRFDPRIPQEMQIKNECYGNPPKFSRGHMTRREDPAWGENIEDATLGNADSMHVTNSVPQMQTFNGGIWLGLEDYALDHAKGDDMQISVFTGPFFRDDDPEQYGVLIPVEFWKIIVFIHDETGKLCATGYTMSQESFLQPEEFVFGRYETYQTTIKSIEERANISFGNLANLDPYKGQEVMPVPLQDLSQVVFK